MKTTITLTFEELIELMAKYLEQRIELLCPCGAKSSLGYSKEELQKHFRHIFQWGLGDE